MGDSYEDFVNAINEDNMVDSILRVSDLTIPEFKQIIREIVMEEVAKVNFVQATPTGRWYGPNPSWMNEVWCSEMPLSNGLTIQQIPNPTTEISKEIM